MSLVEIEALSRRFGSLRALDELTLAIDEGEWVAVTGPSGSGKTTLLNILSGLDHPSAGEVRVGNLDLAGLNARELARYRQQTVGLVFQQFHLIPYLTALENVMLAQYVHSMTDRGEAEEALRRVGLGERLDHLPSQLSGGEQQRVCIARALINQPPLILADEPTGNLDAVNEAIVMSLLADLHQRGHTLILVTHDPSIAARANREIRLEHGRLAQVEQPGDVELQGVLVELWQLIEEDRSGVSIARRGVAELLAAGLLAFADGKIAFTDRGRSQAVSAVRRERLAEVLLERTLSRGPAKECGREVPVAAGFEDQVCTFLDHPAVCPHGRPIPPGADCPGRSTAGRLRNLRMKAPASPRSSRWSPEPSPGLAVTVERRLGMMGTELEMRVDAPSRAAALAAERGGGPRPGGGRRPPSTWRDDSELTRLNRAPVGAPVQLSPRLAAELRGVRHWWRETGGVFDPGIGALVAAWGLRSGGRVPSASRGRRPRAAGGLAALGSRRTAGRRGCAPACVSRRGGGAKAPGSTRRSRRSAPTAGPPPRC